VFLGEPFEVDSEVSETLGGMKTEYLALIKEARVGFDS
jgi:hypothetical protein